MLRRETTPQAASAFLSEVFTQAGHQLNAFQSLCTLAEGIASGQGASQHHSSPSQTCLMYAHSIAVEVLSIMHLATGLQLGQHCAVLLQTLRP